MYAIFCVVTSVIFLQFYMVIGKICNFTLGNDWAWDVGEEGEISYEGKSWMFHIIFCLWNDSSSLSFVALGGSME